MEQKAYSEIYKFSSFEKTKLKNNKIIFLLEYNYYFCWETFAYSPN